MILRLAPAFALAVVGATAAAAEGVSRDARFAAEAVRICIDTSAQPAAVRELAASGQWAVRDPAALPIQTRMVLAAKRKKDRRTFTRTHAWTLEKDGLEMTVGLFDIPDQPKLKQCELVAWDLDHAAVDAAFKADTRFTGDFIEGLPIRNYSVAGPEVRVAYMKSDMGTKSVHVVTVNPLR